MHLLVKAETTEQREADVLEKALNETKDSKI